MSKTFRMRFGIFPKMLLAMLCVSLIPLAVIWFFNYQRTLELTGQKAELQLATFSQMLANRVDDWVEMNQRMLLQNAQLQDVIAKDVGRQDAVLQAIGRNYEWTYLAFTTDIEGNNLGRSDGKPPLYYGDRVYFKQVVDGAPFGKQILIGKTSGKPALVLAAPVHDARKKLSGIIAIAMTLSELSNTITEAKIGQTGHAFLLDENGEVIAHRSETFTQSRADFSKNPAFVAHQAGKSRLIYVDDNGEKSVAAMHKTREGWTVIAQQSYAETFAPVRAANNQSFSLLVVTTVLVSVLAFFLARGMASPIRKLTSAADQLSQGNLAIEITGLDRKDEIGDLAQAVDRLGTSVKLAIERLKKR